MNKREDTYDLSVFVFKVVLWLIFGIFILIFKGFKALLRGDWGQAIAWFAIPGILASIVLFQVGNSYVESRAAEQGLQADQSERQWALSNPSQAFTWERIRGDLSIIPGCYDTGYVAPCDEANGTLYAEYKLTNKLQRSILQLSTIEQELGNYWPYDIRTCMTEWLEFNINYENTLGPGESVTLYCVERYGDVPVTPCVDIEIYPFDKLTTTCSSK